MITVYSLTVSTIIFWSKISFTLMLRTRWMYNRGNQKPYIKKYRIQLPKERQKDNQWPTKHCTKKTLRNANYHKKIFYYGNHLGFLIIARNNSILLKITNWFRVTVS